MSWPKRAAHVLGRAQIQTAIIRASMVQFLRPRCPWAAFVRGERWRLCFQKLEGILLGDKIVPCADRVKIRSPHHSPPAGWFRAVPGMVSMPSQAVPLPSCKSKRCGGVFARNKFEPQPSETCPLSMWRIVRTSWTDVDVTYCSTEGIHYI